MSDLVLHQITEQAIAALIARPVHAVQISGPAGSGKFSIARQAAAGLLGVTVDSLAVYPYIKVVSPDETTANRSISIESIRELQRFLTLRIPGKQGSIARVIIIQDAHTMAAEAQNALLKTLEEPPADTVVILTAQSKDIMLPTIQSRVRHVVALQPTADQLSTHFIGRQYGTADIAKAIMLSGGLPGLTAALLDGNTDHPLVTATVHARGILQSKSYERLLLVDGLSKQKQLSVDVLYVLSQMARMSLLKATDASSVQRWRRILRATYDAHEQLSRNTQVKLVLTNFMLVL